MTRQGILTRIGLRGGVVAISAVVAAVVAVGQSGGAAAAPAEQSAMRGAQVFQQNCAVYHGINAQGRVGPPLLPLPPEIASAPRPALVQELTGLLRNGIPGGMPWFTPAQISDDDVAALVDWFLASNQNPPAGPSFYEAMAPIEAVPDGPNQRYFPETGHSVRNAFLAYWDANGGMEVFGAPLTEEYQSYSSSDGQLRTVQLFENALLQLNTASDGSEEVSVAPLGAELLELRTHFLMHEGHGGPEEGTPGESGEPEMPGSMDGGS